MKLRVCHIVTQLELGGAQRNTLYTMNHLNPDLLEPSLIAGRGGILDEEARAAGWPLYLLNSLVRPIRPVHDLVAFVAIYQRLREFKPHIVHTHSSKAGIVGRLAAYLAGVPVILHTFHGFGFTPAQSRLIHTLFVWAERVCARLSTHLIFVSEDNRQEADRLGVGRGIPNSLIRSGIALKDLPAPVDIRAELQLDPKTPLVVSIGNFKPQKNPLDLVRAAAEIIRQKPEVHVVLAGDGELRPECEALTNELGVAAQIHFVGWRQDASGITAAADCFLLTSLWEGLPRALVEAFALKKPSVAYAVNGVNDIVVDGENGFAVPAGNWQQAAEKVAWILDHPDDAKAMGERAHARVQTEFDIDEMVRQQEQLYIALYDAVPLREYYEPRWNKTPPS